MQYYTTECNKYNWSSKTIFVCYSLIRCAQLSCSKGQRCPPAVFWPVGRRETIPWISHFFPWSWASIPTGFICAQRCSSSSHRARYDVSLAEGTIICLLHLTIRFSMSLALDSRAASGLAEFQWGLGTGVSWTVFSRRAWGSWYLDLRNPLSSLWGSVVALLCVYARACVLLYSTTLIRRAFLPGFVLPHPPCHVWFYL